mgnify:CR=1 FL=1
MSQYKITKARLAQIIKEEYQSLHEEVRPAAPPNALMQNINRWSEEGKAIPKHLTVGRMGGDRVALHQLQGMMYSLRDDFIPYLDGTEEHEIYELVNDLMRRIKSRADELSPGQRTEAKKPDFLDLDKDGDEDESMEKAEKEKKAKTESIHSLRTMIQSEINNL